MVPDKENITRVVQQKLNEMNAFLVDVQLLPGDKITVLADTPAGITLHELEGINRFLNHALDKETNDFELTVSSPGMDRPFTVMPQYLKNKGREVIVLLNDGNRLQGLLTDVTETGFTITARTREKNEGTGKKEWVNKHIPLRFDTIKETRKVITFK